MNIELLIKLTNQAVEKYITLDPANAIPPYHIKYNRILAELIIEECVTIADREKDKSAGCGYITKTKGEEIKEFFGVE